MAIDRRRDRALGWDAAGTEAFAPFAAGPSVRRGSSPSIARRRSCATATGDRPARVSRASFRFEALARSDFPAVGDWVALDGERRHRRGAAAAERRSSGWPPTAAGAASGLDDEQVMAANVDVALLVAGLDNDFNLRRIERYLAVAWSSGITPVVVLNKADLADDVDGRLVAVDAIAPGVATVAGLGADRRGARRAARPPATGHDGRDPRLVRASASRRSSTRCSARTARRPPRSAIRTRAAATRPPIASCSSFPAARCWSTRPGIRALEVLGADEGVEAAFDDVADIAAPAGSAIAGTRASRAAPSGRRSPTAA